jgi:hypothetical protein
VTNELNALVQYHKSVHIHMDLCCMKVVTCIPVTALFVYEIEVSSPLYRIEAERPLMADWRSMALPRAAPRLARLQLGSPEYQ